MSGGNKIVNRTVDQLARFAGVTSDTILVCHAEGLLSPADLGHDRERCYTPQHAEQLLTVRTLTEAGVTAAGIRNLAAASDADIEVVLHDLDGSLGARIQGLERTQRRLRQAASGRRPPQLPPEITEGLRRLGETGFSARWLAAETTLWAQAVAALDNWSDLFRARMAALDEPDTQQRYVDYDRVLDLEPEDVLTRPGGPLALARSQLRANPDQLTNRLRRLRDARRRLRKVDPRQLRTLPTARPPSSSAGEQP